MSENIKTRKYYRVHNGTDWDRMHFVTDANSVDANDGDNMETKVGAIKGITTSTEVTEEGYAADATTVAALNSSLGGIKFKTVDGNKQVSIDGGSTWENFSSGAELLWTNPAPSNDFIAQTIPLDLSDYDSVAIVSQFWKSGGHVHADITSIGIIKVGSQNAVLTQQDHSHTVDATYRIYTVTTDGVVCSDYVGISSSTSIPRYIYGFKNNPIIEHWN